MAVPDPVEIINADNARVSINVPLNPGRALAAESRPVALSNEDKAALDLLHTDLASLSGFIDGLETLVTTLNGYVDGLETLGGTTNTALSAISAFVDGLETLATSLNGYVDGLEAQTGGLAETAPLTDTASSGLNGRLQRIAQNLTAIKALLPSALGAGGGLKIDGSGTALPVDTELPAAAAAADAVANITAPFVQAGGSNFNGITWDRQRSVTLGTSSLGTGIAAAGILGLFDDVTPQTVAENQFGNLRMSAKGVMYGTIRDAAGNERGANVNASNQLAVLAGIDQTTPGTTNAVAITSPAGTRVEATVATGGTAANLFSATPTNGFEVVNPHATEWLYIRENGTATVADNSVNVPIAPRGSYTTPVGYKPTGDVSYVATTTGHAVVGRRW